MRFDKKYRPLLAAVLLGAFIVLIYTAVKRAEGLPWGMRYMGK